ncbi:alpha/beta hydrolase [Cyanobacteria bacterium FACHB-502]|nr:alpha/beta hydrolase [Leptolyngbya sp. FACHB-711]MBD1851939.1 alpha/beta hydrolase [Cyanobacteria bacterium FACHB-502]MBD2027778.1 alpha/beta hydrolase [Leptolyngbya sp. FACHB-711]
MGEGKPILLLPALSSVSSRGEMRGIAERLAQQYQVVAIDWLGFGESSRPFLNYTPPVYRALLRDFVRSMFLEPVVVIAAGHGAGYVMDLTQQPNPPWSWVVLVSPTWRGPLPAAFGEHRWFYKLLKTIVRLPLLGQLLYFLNTLPPFLALMYRRHVYGNGKNVTRKLIGQKWRTTQRWGARHASVAFVTGALDSVKNRSKFMDYFQPLPPVPVLMVIGEQTPPKSRAEMEVLAHFTAVQVYRMPGSLGLHEEYPEELIEGILPFLNKYLS